MSRRSNITIQRYLLLLIISIIVLATFGAALHGYRASMSQFDEIFDNELRALAQSLAMLDLNLTQLEKKQQNLIQSSKLTNQQFSFQIWKNKKLVAKNHTSPMKPFMPFRSGFTQQNFNGKRWQTFALLNDNNWIFVAQPIKLRVQSAEMVLLEAIGPIVLAIPLIALFTLLAIRKSLTPLRELSNKVKLKNPDDLTTIQLNRTSPELQPITETLNSLLKRMESAFSREKCLASDAAHELRTPISVLNITAHNLRTEFYQQSVNEATLAELQQGVARMAHVIEQILLLNRTTPEHFEQQFIELDIELLLQQAINNIYEKIEIKQQKISLHSHSQMLFGDEFSLVTLFENLIGNANKYCTSGCEILITVQQTKHKLNICIEDSGDGMTEQQMAKAFDRFYRAHTSKISHDKQISESKDTVIGCGLGLSIVDHIVTLHNGNVVLSQSKLGGLKVNISFPNENVCKGNLIKRGQNV